VVTGRRGVAGTLRNCVVPNVRDDAGKWEDRDWSTGALAVIINGQEYLHPGDRCTRIGIRLEESACDFRS